jgi:protein-disulfide isomerase
MKNSKYAVTGIVIIAALVAGVYLARRANPVDMTLPAAAGQKSKGPADAPVQIVEFSDFQCPACQKADLVLKSILAKPEYQNKIRVTFNHFPLPNHLWASLAHQAAECAHKEGKFWEYHDRLYAEQMTWSILSNPMETFLGYAKEMNIPVENFGLCLASPDIRKRVLDDSAKGQQAKVSSTPTYIINGERLVGPAELLEKGEALVRRVLKLPDLPAASPSPSPSPTPTPAGP